MSAPLEVGPGWPGGPLPTHPALVLRARPQLASEGLQPKEKREDNNKTTGLPFRKSKGL